MASAELADNNRPRPPTKRTPPPSLPRLPHAHARSEIIQAQIGAPNGSCDAGAFIVFRLGGGEVQTGAPLLETRHLRCEIIMNVARGGLWLHYPWPSRRA